MLLQDIVTQCRFTKLERIVHQLFIRAVLCIPSTVRSVVTNPSVKLCLEVVGILGIVIVLNDLVLILERFCRCRVFGRRLDHDFGGRPTPAQRRG